MLQLFIYIEKFVPGHEFLKNKKLVEIPLSSVRFVMVTQFLVENELSKNQLKSVTKIVNDIDNLTDVEEIRVYLTIRSKEKSS